MIPARAKRLFRSRANLMLATKLAGAGLAYLSTLLLARALEPSEFGQVAVYINAAFLLSVIGARGQQLALLRFLPAARQDPHQSVRELIAAAARRALPTTLGIYGICLSGLLFLASIGAIDDFEPSWFWIGLALIPAVGLADFTVHAARGLGQAHLGLFPKEIVWRGLTVAALALATLAGIELEAGSVLTWLVVTLALVAGWQLRGLLRSLPVSRPAWKLPATGAFWISSVSAVLLSTVDVLSVGLLAGTGVAAGYFLANRMAALLAFFNASHMLVLAPDLSARVAGQDANLARDLAAAATRAASLKTGIFGLFLAALAPWVLGLFGPGYADFAPILWLLIAAAVADAALGPGDTVLNMCGHEDAASRVAALAMVAAVILVPVGAALGGAEGTASAVLATTILRKWTFCREVQRRLGFRVDLVAALLVHKNREIHP